MELFDQQPQLVHVKFVHGMAHQLEQLDHGFYPPNLCCFKKAKFQKICTYTRKLELYE